MAYLLLRQLAPVLGRLALCAWVSFGLRIVLPWFETGVWNQTTGWNRLMMTWTAVVVVAGGKTHVRLNFKLR